MEVVRAWFRRHFSDPQVVVLALLLLGGVVVTALFGRMLGPVLAGLVIAYLLSSPVEALERRGLPRLLAVALVFAAFVGAIAVALLMLLPLLSRQLTQLVLQLPSMLTRIQELLLELPQRYPELIAPEQVVELTGRLRGDLLGLGQSALLFSVDQIGSLFTAGIYLFVVPLMVFFFLKDRDVIFAWLGRFLPRQPSLAGQVWRDVDRMIGAYARGKVYEIAIVAGVTWLAFTLLGVEFAMLLAVATGLSVLIPYVGVVAAAVPVALVALVQFGLGGQFAAVVGAYAVIQTLDGNVLAPLLISEVVDIHPIAVVSAILLFGGVWGFWGVFFAIPLATLTVAVLNAWPRFDDADRARLEAAKRLP